LLNQPTDRLNQPTVLLKYQVNMGIDFELQEAYKNFEKYLNTKQNTNSKPQMTTTSGTNTTLGNTTHAFATYPPTSWATTTSSSSTYSGQESWYGMGDVSEEIKGLLTSLGLTEDLINNEFVLSLDAKIRISIAELSILTEPEQQRVIGRYLERMRNQITEKLKDKILINKLVDLTKDKEKKL